MSSNLMKRGIRELRFVLCNSSAHSNGVRSFIMNNYEDVKGANPDMPFIVRECTNAQPTVMARYNFGVERRLYLNNASESEVNEAVNELVEQADAINNAAAKQF